MFGGREAAIKIAAAPLISRESIIQRIRAVVQGEERDLFKFNAGESPAPPGVDDRRRSRSMTELAGREGVNDRRSFKANVRIIGGQAAGGNFYDGGYRSLQINDSEIL